MVEQKDLTVESLTSLVESLFRWGRTPKMGQRAHALARSDTCRRILEDLQTFN